MPSFWDWLGITKSRPAEDIGWQPDQAWTSWMYQQPPGEILVEVRRRYGDGCSSFLRRCDLPPEFNVYNLYWRPVERCDD
jgi:hypothetical protein